MTQAEQQVEKRAHRRKLRVGGTLDPETDVYVERADYDTRLLELLEEGQYCNVLTSRQMGKSSLITRVARTLLGQEPGLRLAMIDIAGSIGTPPDADPWYIGFLQVLESHLELGVDVSAFWHSAAELPINTRFVAFFRDVVLKAVPGRVIVFVDEVDKTRDLPYTDDFFFAIRSMWNARPNDEEFRRLTFCLAGAANPNDLVKSRNATPYNIGETLELRDFDSTDRLDDLRGSLSSDPDVAERLLKRVLYWTDGHPFLTAAMCATMKDAATAKEVDERVANLFSSTTRDTAIKVHFDTIARIVSQDLGSAELLAYRRVLRGASLTTSSTAYPKLKLVGLVKANSAGKLVVRNRIYARQFDAKWLGQSKPIRALFRNFAIAALVGPLALAAAWAWVENQRREQQVEGERARLEKALASDTDEVAAKKHYEQLSGTIPSEALDRNIPGECRKAKGLYEEFWQRRGDHFRNLAKRAKKDPEAAYLYNAIAALKDGRPLDPSKLTAYQSIQVTLVPTGTTSPPPSLGALSPDGKRALLYRNDALEIRDLTTAPWSVSHTRSVEAPSRVTALAWAGLGKELVVRDQSTIEVSENLAAEVPLPLPPAARNSKVEQVVYPALDHELLLVGKQRTDPRVASVFSCGWPPEARCHTQLQGWVAEYARDRAASGPAIVTGSYDGSIRVFDAKYKELRDFSWRAEGLVAKVALRSDGTVLAAWHWQSDSEERWLKSDNVVLHYRRGKQIAFATQYPIVNFVQFCGPSRLLIASTRPAASGVALASAAELWDVSSIDKATRLPTPLDLKDVSFLGANGSCDRVLGGTKEGAVRVWNVGQPAEAWAKDPADLWRRLQQIFGRTVDPNGDIVELTEPPREITSRPEIPDCAGP